MSDMTSATDPAWSLVQLKPNGLNTALRNLGRQGFEVFVPRHSVTRRVGGRFRDRLEPLFPGYIFVEVGRAASPWRKINSTLGVARLVQFGSGGPAIVASALVEGLMARCNGDGVLEPISEIAPGDMVRISRGPFADFVAKVETIDKDRRVWMLLDLMGRQTRIAVSARDVSAA
ncbi:transcription termination/antitermination protein NusG [Jhaorihella thermophila]|uniref:Transcription termination/antitermination protein NusG n=1 Tax=Jhaorihella thermophila TaxID=488547 RepID=A0A1H5YKT8_9RHOB|nr:transcription termination/antitermination NusG family protein [Jhaorihella thermophila]SEG24614.1 transcriptional antiterminator RfaH [Jhaorihella thermophila]